MKYRSAAPLRRGLFVASAIATFLGPSSARAQLAVRGETVYTMAGAPIKDGVVVIRDGKIADVGEARDVKVPDGARVIAAKVVTPGLIDAHSVVGLSGLYNHPHDQDQLEHSDPMQPELRAIDAYNPQEKLIEWVRSFGVTTLHTGHAPGELISGQTCIVKTTGNTIGDAVVVDAATVAATLSPMAQKSEKGKSPGTRGKMMAMLRQQFVKAQEYMRKRETAEEDKKPARDLALEVLVRVLKKELPLMITAYREQDIDSSLRLAKEFDIKIILDGGAESYLMLDEIKAAGVPVIVHATMQRTVGDAKNLSLETAAKLRDAGIPIAIQTGYEDYVPKTRIVLFEAALAAANKLGFDDALKAITIWPAKIFGIDNRVGSLEIGKDADIAMYDGDPFEYTTHCTGTIINGQVVSEMPH